MIFHGHDFSCFGLPGLPRDAGAARGSDPARGLARALTVQATAVGGQEVSKVAFRVLAVQIWA